METNISIINNTKMQEIRNYQPCASDEIIEVPDSPPPTNLEVPSGTVAGSLRNVNASIDSDCIYMSNVQKEPIDMTLEGGHLGENNLKKSNPKTIILQAKRPENLVKNTLNERGIKTNADNATVHSMQIAPSFQTPYHSSPHLIPEMLHQERQKASTSAYSYAIVHAPPRELATRQQEILKLAKSIFSKRTRTLYHWMYPSVSKQQIKQVVSSTWESMAAQEKNIYIAQVLGRFGYNNANLMVNPQLEQIKELSPMVRKFNPEASELQTAISSISNDTSGFMEPCYSLEQPRKKSKLPKKKPGQSLPTACQEFNDDPELSQEFAQFSKLLNNHF